jgi:diadenosine tetraphosphate (Ap4A) HIT family hydrolase
MAYDDQNIFAKIIRGEIPSKKIYEDVFALAFYDINPLTPVHALVIPKGPYENHKDFSDNASIEEQAGFTKAIGKTAEMIGVAEGGYRLITNCGVNGGQEVPHYHVHILGGGPVGRMINVK